jgi:hypothetical protein
MPWRLWPRVNKTETCWLWTGRTDKDGYPLFDLEGRALLAHRLIFELLVGPIPEGMTLDHIKERGCTSKACVKAIADEHGPAHLEPVTSLENTRRHWAGITHCKNGHLFDEANTAITVSGHRNCRACDRDASARYKAKAGLK